MEHVTSFTGALVGKAMTASRPPPTKQLPKTLSILYILNHIHPHMYIFWKNTTQAGHSFEEPVVGTLATYNIAF